jgi:hypothetical protein
LLDNGQSIASINLSGNPPFSVAFDINTPSRPLAPGAHSFSLKYAGDTHWAASTSPSDAITINHAPTATTVSTSSTSVLAGQSVTLTARVSGEVGSLALGGTVQFADGANSLGSPVPLTNNTATYSTSALAPGSHSITATYAGDTNYLPSTGPTVSVAVEDFTVQPTTTTLSVSPGGSATVTLAVTAEGGLDQSTSFACSGLPKGVTCSFNPPTVTGTGSTVLTIAVAGSHAANVPTPLGKRMAQSSGVLVACAFWILLPLRCRKKRSLLLCFAWLAVLGLGLVQGCIKNPVTPAGTYSVTVIAITGTGSSAITHTTMLTLVVK